MHLHSVYFGIEKLQLKKNCHTTIEENFILIMLSFCSIFFKKEPCDDNHRSTLILLGFDADLVDIVLEVRRK